jgi:hypothetical protein
VLEILADEVRLGQTGNDRMLRDHAGAGQPERIEDALLQDLRVRLAVELLDDLAENEVVGVVVVEHRARRVDQRSAAEPGDQLVARVRRLVDGEPVLDRVLRALDLVDVVEPRRVVEQLMHGDLVGARAPVARQVALDRRAKIEPSRVAQLQDQRRGERLGDRRDLVLRVIRVRHLQLDAGQAEAPRVLDLPAALDQDRAAELVLLRIALDERLRNRGRSERDGRGQ